MEWKQLTDLTAGRAFRISRVRLEDSGIAIEGDFDPPPLARLSSEDQSFVAAFVHCHGSIKQMERWFGVSYPTIKARLNRVAGQLDFAEVVEGADLEPEADAGAVLDRLEAGEMTVEEALRALET